MNTDKLREKLLAAARTTPLDDRVPYAFEKRIMANLAAQPSTDAAQFWGCALWRATVPCLMVTLLLGAFSFLPVTVDTEQADDLSSHYENAMLAAADQQEELW